MKNFIYHFIVYIGLALAVFNSNPAFGVSAEPFRFGLSPTSWDKNKPIIETKNEFYKLLIVPLLADKLFPDDKINQDLTLFLKHVWPEVSETKLKIVGTYIQIFVGLKRRWNYVTERLQNNIKAASVFPEGAPVIAKDGEFAPAFSDKRKTTSDKEYAVSYTPYKYLEYASGEIGNPVRRRDKNFQETPSSVLDEITLALLEFNIGKLFRALQKIPVYNDGSRETPVDLKNGVKARIYLGVARPGDKEKIRGAIEVYLPNGLYINGDYLNQHKKTSFILSEDPKEDLNIKDYRIYSPIPAGVVINGRPARVLNNTVSFPVEFTRKNIEKPMHIKGLFSFELCDAATAVCHRTGGMHSLSLSPSETYTPSVYENYVAQTFLRLPKEKSKHAELAQALLDKENKTLTITFKTSKTFSNTAVLPETSENMDFINPRYQITNDKITATFDIISPALGDSSSPNNVPTNNNDSLLALTASFDDNEFLRTTVTPKTVSAFGSPSPHPAPLSDKPSPFVLGLLLFFMPGAFYLYKQLLCRFGANENPVLVLVRCAYALAFGLFILACVITKFPPVTLYENAQLQSLCLILSVSLLIENTGYMNFSLFRPFKKFIPHGIFIGLSCLVFAAAFPFSLTSETLVFASSSDLKTLSFTFLLIWLGMVVILLLSLFFIRYLARLILSIHYLNIPCTIFGILTSLWLIYAFHGLPALFVSLFFALLTALLWFTYPHALEQTVRHTRSRQNKQYLFEKVQRHALIALTVILVLQLSIISFFPKKCTSIPSRKAVMAEVSPQLSSENAFLFTITSDWSLVSLFNRITVKNLKDKGLPVFSGQMCAQSPETNAWLKTYAKTLPPLNVLFTKRHPEGLVLPNNLRDVNWERAIKNFN